MTASFTGRVEPVSSYECGCDVRPCQTDTLAQQDEFAKNHRTKWVADCRDDSCRSLLRWIQYLRDSQRAAEPVLVYLPVNYGILS